MVILIAPHAIWTVSMASITNELAAILTTVRRPGDFFASGLIELLAPQLEVDGVGQIALPLLPTQAKQLVAAAERAPFGLGQQTLVDTAVRRTWRSARTRSGSRAGAGRGH